MDCPCTNLYFLYVIMAYQVAKPITIPHGSPLKVLNFDETIQNQLTLLIFHDFLWIVSIYKCIFFEGLCATHAILAAGVSASGGPTVISCIYMQPKHV